MSSPPGCTHYRQERLRLLDVGTAHCDEQATSRRTKPLAHQMPLAWQLRNSPSAQQGAQAETMEQSLAHRSRLAGSALAPISHHKPHSFKTSLLLSSILHGLGASTNSGINAMSDSSNRKRRPAEGPSQERNDGKYKRIRNEGGYACCSTGASAGVTN